MDLYFPFPSERKLQTSLMAYVLQAIENKGQLLVHAPTGTGKTIGILAPALTHVLKKDPRKTIYFLSSRNTQHTLATDTLRNIKKQFGIKVVSVDFIAKREMCCQDGVQELNAREFIEYCKDLREKGNCHYYRNIRFKNNISPECSHVLGKLKEESPLHVEELKSICKNTDLCSYEMAAYLAKDAQVIIADYNYILHPKIRESLFERTKKDLSNAVLIFDEGHNLPKRSRELLSANTSTLSIELARREAHSTKNEDLAAFLQKFNDWLEKYTQENLKGNDEMLITKELVIKKIEEYSSIPLLCKDLEFISDQILEHKRRSFALALSHFFEAWDGPDNGFTRILKKQEGKGRDIINISYRCLDPSILLRPVIEAAHATIVMSGTLRPLSMYKDILGFSKNVQCIEYENPFPAENRLSLIIPETSTKFRTRSDGMYKKISEKCAQFLNHIPGNVIIFFPSYQVRDNVYLFLKDNAAKTMFLEESAFTKEQRTELLERFKSYKDSGAVLLAVAGGSFAEGIDLPGKLLRGVIVVGLPLARPDLETKELIKYYDTRFGNGWDYGYVYPAIIKTLQSAGRCIRSETDRGVLIFLDERYAWQNYRSCFPLEYEMKQIKDPGTIIDSFFQKEEKLI